MNPEKKSPHPSQPRVGELPDRTTLGAPASAPAPAAPGQAAPPARLRATSLVRFAHSQAVRPRRTHSQVVRPRCAGRSAGSSRCHRGSPPRRTRPRPLSRLAAPSGGPPPSHASSPWRRNWKRVLEIRKREWKRRGRKRMCGSLGDRSHGGERNKGGRERAVKNRDGEGPLVSGVDLARYLCVSIGTGCYPSPVLMCGSTLY
jgi:hypothetical protein